MVLVDPNLCMKWALVCSISDDVDKDTLKNFSEWFLSEVGAVGRSIGLSYHFEKSPETVEYPKPGVMQDCIDAYNKIAEKFPATHLVVHILPESQSPEYEWMKALSTRLGYIRQGVLAHNALTRFDGGEDLTDIFKNVVQWINRSAYTMSSMRNPRERFDVRVGNGKPVVVKNYPPKVIQTAANCALHGDDTAVCRDESAVKVEGYPSRLSEFGVAQLFGELSVTGVTLRGNTATVVFTNKFHAFQALSLNDKVIDRRHTLKITALAQDVIKQAESA